MDLVDHIAEQLRQAGLGPRDRLAVAYSGGPDSTALLLLTSMALGPTRLVAIHVDHGVRPTSAADLAHCERAAQHLGVRFRSRRLSSREAEELAGRHGPEGALRKLRYRALAEICRDEGIAWVATGHTADDVIETHLLAMLRGSGLTGLAGPRARRELDADIWLVRPLLDRTRDELLGYLEDQLGGGELGSTASSLSPVHDETNRDTRYARNRLRHQVIPVLVELAGGIEPLLRSVDMLRTDRAHLEQLLAEGLERLDVDVIGQIGPFGGPKPRSGNEGCLDLSGVADLERPEITAVLRAFVARHAGGHPPSSQLVRQLRHWLAEPGRTRWVDAPGCRLRVAAGKVVVEPPSRAKVALESDPAECLAARQLRVGGAVRSPELGITVLAEVIPETPMAAVPRGPDEVVFDLSRLGEEATDSLALRSARPGDRFRPFGMKGSVRLFRWLAGLGVARSSRPDIPVVTCGESIIWVVGRRRGDQAIVTGESRELLRLRVIG